MLVASPRIRDTSSERTRAVSLTCTDYRAAGDDVRRGQSHLRSTSRACDQRWSMSFPGLPAIGATLIERYAEPTRGLPRCTPPRRACCSRVDALAGESREPMRGRAGGVVPRRRLRRPPAGQRGGLGRAGRASCWPAALAADQVAEVRPAGPCSPATMRSRAGRRQRRGALRRRPGHPGERRRRRTPTTPRGSGWSTPTCRTRRSARAGPRSCAQLLALPRLFHTTFGAAHWEAPRSRQPHVRAAPRPAIRARGSRPAQAKGGWSRVSGQACRVRRRAWRALPAGRCETSTCARSRSPHQRHAQRHQPVVQHRLDRDRVSAVRERAPGRSPRTPSNQPVRSSWVSSRSIR